MGTCTLYHALSIIPHTTKRVWSRLHVRVLGFSIHVRQNPSSVNVCLSRLKRRTKLRLPSEVSAVMLRQQHDRIDPKRRNVVDHRKKQFATPQYKETDYPTRLNFYSDAPTADVTLEQFEQWAIDRLRGMLTPVISS